MEKRLGDCRNGSHTLRGRRQRRGKRRLSSGLNVNGTGAKPIYRYGTTAPSTTAATSWQAGAVVSLTYNGTNWIITGWINDNTTYGAATQSAAGLMSAADKKTLDEVSAKMEGAKMLIDIVAGGVSYNGTRSVTLPYVAGATMAFIEVSTGSSSGSTRNAYAVIKGLKSSGTAVITDQKNRIICIYVLCKFKWRDNYYLYNYYQRFL